MKILLIDAIDYKSTLQLALPHLGLGYIASYLREKFKPIPKIKIINKYPEKEIKNFNPNIVGISSVTENFNIAKTIARFCKERNIYVVVGGHHISIMPESLDTNMDVGVIGEGEQTFLEVVNLFSQVSTEPNSLKKVDGIVFWGNNDLKVTNKRTLIDPLDQIPFPARDLFDISRNDVVHLFTSRGCPYRCVFCSSSRFWGKVRFFSVDYLIREIKEILKQYKPSLIQYSDDLFTADRKRIRQLADLINNEKINERVSFTCKSRADLVNEDLIKDLKKMNVVEIGMGLESGCEETLSYLKSKVTINDNLRAVELFRKHNILVNPTFIIGAPYERREQVMETLKFIKTNKIDQFSVFTLTPLPGTPVWDYALKRGLVSNDMDWSKLVLDPGVSKKNVINLSEYLTSIDLRDLLKLFEVERKKRYYMNLLKKGFKRPRQILPFMNRKIRLFFLSKT